MQPCRCLERNVQLVACVDEAHNRFRFRICVLRHAARANLRVAMSRRYGSQQIARATCRIQFKEAADVLRKRGGRFAHVLLGASSHFNCVAERVARLGSAQMCRRESEYCSSGFSNATVYEHAQTPGNGAFASLEHAVRSITEF